MKPQRRIRFYEVPESELRRWNRFRWWLIPVAGAAGLFLALALMAFLTGGGRSLTILFGALGLALFFTALRDGMAPARQMALFKRVHDLTVGERWMNLP